MDHWEKKNTSFPWLRSPIRILYICKIKLRVILCSLDPFSATKSCEATLQKELGVTWDVNLYGEWPDNAPKTEEERNTFIASLHKQKSKLFMALVEIKLMRLPPGVAK